MTRLGSRVAGIGLVLLVVAVCCLAAAPGSLLKAANCAGIEGQEQQAEEVEVPLAVEEFLAVAGLNVLVLAVIQVLKKLGAIPDGYAGRWAGVLSMVVYAGCWIGGVFGFDVMGTGAQQVIGILGQIAQVLLAIVGSPLMFKLLRWLGIVQPQKAPAVA